MKIDGKCFYIQPHSIGTAKHVVNFHDGESTHGDGSPFFGIKIFSSKIKMLQFVRDLKKEGYVEK